jgi:WD40 repeat protein
LRFEALVGRGRALLGTDPAGGVRLFGEALGLWRGPALDDLARQPSLRPEAARLEELRVAATEERVAAELDLGRHRELVPELETLVAASPLRERLWGQLMVALYRSGRQGDALVAYQRARELLAEELGIDPSPQLRRLQEQVLRQDPALEVAGEPLRGYRLLEVVGAGFFGVVHRAFQPQVGREVAVKVVHRRFADDPEFIRRFEAEAQLVARLEHPHVVPLYDFWREPDGAYLVLRYLRGGSLRERLADGPLDAEEAVGVVEQVAGALAAAHRQGVVHRDVKPANVLFDDDGNAYLTDFGIARDLTAAVAGNGASPLVYYLSPEELRGEAATPYSDVYSLGLVVYEILTARHPYADTPAAQVADQQLHHPLPSVHAVRGDLPAAVDDVLARATAKDPTDRYPDPRELAAAFREALLPVVTRPLTAPGTEARNPYKGLRPFAAADALDFYGREALVAELLGRLAEHDDGARFLAVVGPSGSGKSSVVRAGLVPALRRGALAGSDRWFVVEMHPGHQPFEELAAVLTRVAVNPPADLVERLEGDEHGLWRAAQGALPADSELLVVIDQFEELFTLIDDEDRRARFLRSVLAAATDQESAVRVLVTLRADFYDRPLAYPGLAELVKARTVTVTPLTAEELQRAVSGPAAGVGVGVDPALLADVVADVATQPGALPLLQYALTELFDRRTASILGVEAYHDIGGVSGALARRAENLYARLNEAGRQATRQLFLRLVTLGADGSEDSRRRVLRAELAALEVEREAVEAAIDTFGARRLLSFDRDPATRGPTVEVAHEALLREWGRLRGWIEGAREDVRAHRRLAAAAREWAEADRDPGFLLRGAHLARFDGWSATSGLALTGDERAYLDASLAQRDAERAAEEARAERERALERRSLVRLRALVAVFAVLGVVASGLTVLAVNQRERAEREALVARARELAAAAVANLDEDPERSILLALEAVEQTRAVDGRVLPEAEEALHRAVVASRAVLTVPGVGGALAWSPDGSVFVTEGPEDTGVIDIRDAATGESLRTWHGHDVDVNDVAFNHDGSMLATTGDDGVARVWDPATGLELSSVQGEPETEVWGPSFSGDGVLAAAAWFDEGVVRVWDSSTGEIVNQIGSLEGPRRTSFSPSSDDARLAVSLFGGGFDAGFGGGYAVVVDLRSGDEVLRLDFGQPFGLTGVAWSSDGRWIATGNRGATAGVWDARTGDLHDTLHGHTSVVWDAAWSPVDPSRLVTGSEDGSARLWEIADTGARELLVLSAQDYGGVYGVAFSPDGERVMTGDRDISAVKIWDVGSAGDAEWANRQDMGLPTFTPDGRAVVSATVDGSVVFWDPESGEDLRTVPDRGPPFAPPDSLMTTLAVSPDGTLVASGGSDQAVTVWAAATGEDRFTVDHGDWVEDSAWSPDGELLATAGWDGLAKIVNRTGEVVAELEEDPGFGVAAVRFSPDGRLLATTRLETGRADPLTRQVKLWDWRRGEVLQTIVTWTLQAVAFDPTGTRVATTHTAGTPELWDVETGERIATLVGHSGAVGAVTFSPDGSLLATAGFDATVRLWDVESAVLALTLRGHAEQVWDVAFSPDGSKLVSFANDGIRVWALDIDDLIGIARGKLTRELTEEECRQYLRAPCPAPE